MKLRRGQKSIRQELIYIMELQPLFLVAHFWFRMLPQGTRCVAQIIWFEFWFSFLPRRHGFDLVWFELV